MAKLKSSSRDGFTSKFGVVAAAAGSAVGLGNIWKFPYITGVYGGAAFLFVYLAFILAIGLPVMISEFMIGRSSKRNTIGAFKVLAPNTQWKYIGVLGVGAAIMILSFYGVVAGWSVQYIILSLQDGFANKSPQEIEILFTNLIESPIRPVVLQLSFMVATAVIVIAGVHKGIEKFSKILMPLLVVILIVLVIKSLTLSGADKGVAFLFNPDFSKLTTEGVLSALGHAFFTLSLGMGTLITYGSYIKPNNNLVKTAVSVITADTLIAILAGVAIFPAVFAFGVEPDSGAGLVFITLPNVFHQMSGGYFFSILFFVLLSVAAITSSISILEVVVAYMKEELKMKRKMATIIAAAVISILGVLCSLSMGVLDSYTLFGLSFFDLMDWISANMLLPLGGLFVSLFTGWYYKKKRVRKELEQGGSVSEQFLSIFMFLVKIVAPIAIAIVFLYGIGILKF